MKARVYQENKKKKKKEKEKEIKEMKKNLDYVIAMVICGGLYAASADSRHNHSSCSAVFHNKAV